MCSFTICLDSAVAELYRGIAQVSGRPVESVLADMLFLLAGGLSLDALEPLGQDALPS